MSTLSEADFGRRRFLARAAAAGAVAFAAPAIIAVSPAGATSLTSPPPKPPEQPPTEVLPEVETPPDPGVADPAVAGAAAEAGGTLPFTGANVKELGVAGVVATISGGAMVLWSADPARRRLGFAGQEPHTPPAA